MEHLVKNGLFYDQSALAFWEGHSAESVMIKLTDRILFTLDKDQVTGILFVDIREAFEISEVLFNKLFGMTLDKNMSIWLTCGWAM